MILKITKIIPISDMDRSAKNEPAIIDIGNKYAII